MPAVLDYEELGGLSDPGPQDCAHRIVPSKKRKESDFY